MARGRNDIQAPGLSTRILFRMGRGRGPVSRTIDRIIPHNSAQVLKALEEHFDRYLNDPGYILAPMGANWTINTDWTLLEMMTRWFPDTEKWNNGAREPVDADKVLKERRKLFEAHIKQLLPLIAGVNFRKTNEVATEEIQSWYYQSLEPMAHAIGFDRPLPETYRQTMTDEEVAQAFRDQVDYQEALRKHTEAIRDNSSRWHMRWSGYGFLSEEQALKAAREESDLHDLSASRAATMGLSRWGSEVAYAREGNGRDAWYAWTSANIGQIGMRQGLLLSDLLLHGQKTFDTSDLDASFAQCIRRTLERAQR